VHDVKAAHRIRVQLERFSGKLSRGLPKVGRRLFREILYGVQARGSVRLSEIARALAEPTTLKKVIERLGRQLGRAGLREQVRDNLLSQAAGRIGKDTLLVTDPTDLTKPYARKMEYLAEVRDGSAKRIGPGYWCMTVVAAQRGTARIVPSTSASTPSSACSPNTSYAAPNASTACPSSATTLSPTASSSSSSAHSAASGRRSSTSARPFSCCPSTASENWGKSCGSPRILTVVERPAPVAEPYEAAYASRF